MADKQLRILFVTSAHNSLSQRAYIALTEMGHDVTVQVVDSPEIIEAAVDAHEPDLVVCPMLKQFIPETVWAQVHAAWSSIPVRTAIVVRPRLTGRSSSAFDEWGVTVLEAVEEADAGDIWETRKFKMRSVGKSSIYRHEVRRAAVEMLVFAVHNFARGDFEPTAAELRRPERDRAGCAR